MTMMMMSVLRIDRFCKKNSLLTLSGKFAAKQSLEIPSHHSHVSRVDSIYTLLMSLQCYTTLWNIKIKKSHHLQSRQQQITGSEENMAVAYKLVLSQEDQLEIHHSTCVTTQRQLHVFLITFSPWSSWLKETSEQELIESVRSAIAECVSLSSFGSLVKIHNNCHTEDSQNDCCKHIGNKKKKEIGAKTLSLPKNDVPSDYTSSSARKILLQRRRYDTCPTYLYFTWSLAWDVMVYL